MSEFSSQQYGPRKPYGPQGLSEKTADSPTLALVVPSPGQDNLHQIALREAEGALESGNYDQAKTWLDLVQQTLSLKESGYRYLSLRQATLRVHMLIETHDYAGVHEIVAHEMVEHSLAENIPAERASPTYSELASSFSHLETPLLAKLCYYQVFSLYHYGRFEEAYRAYEFWETHFEQLITPSSEGHSQSDMHSLCRLLNKWNGPARELACLQKEYESGERVLPCLLERIQPILSELHNAQDAPLVVAQKSYLYAIFASLDQLSFGSPEKIRESQHLQIAREYMNALRPFCSQGSKVTQFVQCLDALLASLAGDPDVHPVAFTERDFCSLRFVQSFLPLVLKLSVTQLEILLDEKRYEDADKLCQWIENDFQKVRTRKDMLEDPALLITYLHHADVHYVQRHFGEARKHAQVAYTLASRYVEEKNEISLEALYRLGIYCHEMLTRVPTVIESLEHKKSNRISPVQWAQMLHEHQIDFELGGNPSEDLHKGIFQNGFLRSTHEPLELKELHAIASGLKERFFERALWYFQEAQQITRSLKTRGSLAPRIEKATQRLQRREAPKAEFTSLRMAG